MGTVKAKATQIKQAAKAEASKVASEAKKVEKAVVADVVAEEKKPEAWLSGHPWLAIAVGVAIGFILRSLI